MFVEMSIQTQDTTEGRSPIRIAAMSLLDTPTHISLGLRVQETDATENVSLQ
jgi:hypothetical protein